MNHSMKLLEKPFNNIKNGAKTVEFRLYDEKRKQIQIGDIIEFSKLPEQTEKLSVKVIDLYPAKTFRELFKKLNTSEDEIEKKVQGMYTIYSPEKEAEYGVIGIKIELI